MNDTAYPTYSQDPATGVCEGSRPPPCKKCLYHGTSHEFKIIKPCTICAMNNKGKWGWEEGRVGEEEYLQDENGALPGKCGVQDCLKRNELEGNNPRTLNEQIVLGFAQYALYNHLKWSDIFYEREGDLQYSFGRGMYMEEYISKYSPEDTIDIEDESTIDHVWFWWKMIPPSVCLPERLVKTLVQMLLSFRDEQHEGCVPKTSQKLDGELSDDIWTDLFETYVEPVQVAHLFHLTLIKALEYDDEVEFNSVSFNGEDPLPLPEDIGAIDKKWIMETSSFMGMNVENLKYIFYKKINYEVEEGESGRTKTKVIKIFDRNMFGTYLDDVTHYDWSMCRSWYRRTDIWYPVPNIIEANGEDRRRHGWEKELWNPGIDRWDILNHLQEEVYEYIGYASTEFWEDLIREEMMVGDYENERSFNEYITNIDPSEIDDYHSVTFVVNDEDDWPSSIWMDDLDGWMPRSVARQLNFGNEEIDYNSEIEYEPDEIEENNNTTDTKLVDVVEKLKDLQMFVDDSVKDSVPEGVYLELVNKMLDVYKSAK